MPIIAVYDSPHNTHFPHPFAALLRLQLVEVIGGDSFSITEDIHCCGPPICPTSRCFTPATTYHTALADGCKVFGRSDPAVAGMQVSR